jgi:carbohydrate-binding DOMON domain-containing protein
VETYTKIERPSALPAVRTLVHAVRSYPASTVAREDFAGVVAVRIRPIAAGASRVNGTNGSTAIQRVAAMSKQLKGAPRGVPPRGRPV